MAVSKRQFEALSDFRMELAEFARFSQESARLAGITPLQYLLLLHAQGFPDRDWATVGELTSRLGITPQSTVSIVKRCERLGLLCKRKGRTDKRRVEVHATESARTLIEQIAARNIEELKRHAHVFRIEKLATKR